MQTMEDVVAESVARLSFTMLALGISAYSRSATPTAAMTAIDTAILSATATVRANNMPHPTLADVLSENVST
jgi:hypothetical protein